jgi:hypothetical protein
MADRISRRRARGRVAPQVHPIRLACFRGHGFTTRPAIITLFRKVLWCVNDGVDLAAGGLLDVKEWNEYPEQPHFGGIRNPLVVQWSKGAKT